MTMTSVSRAVEVALHRVLDAYALMSTRADVHEKQPELRTYLETLAAAGQTDPDRLAVFGFAFLRRELHVEQGFSGL